MSSKGIADTCRSFATQLSSMGVVVSSVVCGLEAVVHMILY